MIIFSDLRKYCILGFNFYAWSECALKYDILNPVSMLLVTEMNVYKREPSFS